MDIIDKKAFQPAYSQLVDILKGQIDSGIYPPGAWLPSESKLCKKYDVSAVTVRRAINILAEEGVVETTKGKGTLVKALDLDMAAFNLGRLQEVFQDHTSTQIKLLYIEIIPADPGIADRLGIDADERVIHIRRGISRFGEPLVYHEQFLKYDPRQPIVEAEISLTSLQGLLEASRPGGVKKGILDLKVTVLNKTEANYFKKEPGIPAFRLEHLFYDLKNNAINWGWFCFFSESLKFTTRVGMWPTVGTGGPA